MLCNTGSHSPGKVKGIHLISWSFRTVDIIYSFSSVLGNYFSFGFTRWWRTVAIWLLYCALVIRIKLMMLAKNGLSCLLIHYPYFFGHGGTWHVPRGGMFTISTYFHRGFHVKDHVYSTWIPRHLFTWMSRGMFHVEVCLQYQHIFTVVSTWRNTCIPHGFHVAVPAGYIV